MAGGGGRLAGRWRSVRGGASVPSRCQRDGLRLAVVDVAGMLPPVLVFRRLITGKDARCTSRPKMRSSRYSGRRSAYLPIMVCDKRFGLVSPPGMVDGGFAATMIRQAGARSSEAVASTLSISRNSLINSKRQRRGPWGDFR